jgi:NADH-quinone oxidoreductase subunit G
MIEIEIDGKKLKAEPGSMIIEAADNANIYIPRFCYHKKLSIAANCRMCLVEVEKVPKPLPACATPVTDGMKVMTKSASALEAQKYVMEFLLINHPLDCPICDQGGECELQDISMGFGRDDSKFTEAKRSVADDDLGSLIASDMTRCIACTRCVRFGQEIAGIQELGLLNRGNKVQISTYVKHSLKSELSGNIIDLCPVGALTSKPYRFKARPWELNQTASVSPHDCVGSNLFIHTRREKIMRVVPHENEAINETWLSDRDRFSYLGLQHEDRIAKPMIKHRDQWQEVDWTKAFEYAAKGLKEIIREFGADQVAALTSAGSTMEEGYLLQAIMRDLGSENIDYRVQQQDFADEAAHQSRFDIKIEEFSKQDSVFLIGSNIRREQPILSNRIRTATQQQDAKVTSLNLYKIDHVFPMTVDSIVHPEQMVSSLASIAKVLGAESNAPEKLRAGISQANISDDAKAIAEVLKYGENKLIILGSLALNHPQAATLRSLARVIAKTIGAKVAELTAGGNAAGLDAVNAKPGKGPGKGLNAWNAIQEKLKAYILYNLEPDMDCTNPGAVAAALEKAGFVIAFSAFKSNLLEQHADIIFPIVPFSETDGTFMNVEGTQQSFKAAVPCFGEARPGWKVLRVFGNMLQLDGYQYTNNFQVLEELQKSLTNEANDEIFDVELVSGAANGLTRIAEWPLYRSDAIVRRAEALQKSGANEAFALRINQATAAKLSLYNLDKVKVNQGKQKVEVSVMLSEDVPDDCIYLPSAYTETASLGESFGPIEVEPIKVGKL